MQFLVSDESNIEASNGNTRGRFNIKQRASKLHWPAQGDETHQILMKSETLIALSLTIHVFTHLVAGKPRFLDVVPRSRWLSFAGGISVAYAFVHLLPKLNEHQEVLQESTNDTLALLEHHAYVMALAGLVAFYGLARAAKISRKRQRNAASANITSGRVFWISISAFNLYYSLIGYLLARQADSGLLKLAWYERLGRGQGVLF